MAIGLHKMMTTALISGMMVFAVAAPSWAKIDYTSKNGGNAVAIPDIAETPGQALQAMQAFAQMQGMQQALQGNMGNMLATTISQQLMSGQFDPSQMLQAVGQQMIQQAIGKLMEQAGLSNFGGFAQDFAGGAMGTGNNIFGGISGVGNSLGGVGNNFGGFDLSGGLTGGSSGFGGLIENIATNAAGQIIAGGIQAGIDKLTNGGSGGGGSSYDSQYDPVDTSSNNFGGATIVLSKDAAVNTSSDNYNAGLNAAISGQSKDSTYLINTGQNQGVYDSNYLAGYNAGLPYYNTASN